MTKKMEENERGLSIFGTDFASKGLSFAGHLYQKWENICQDNVMVQDTSELVDAISEQLKKICEEVADDWLNPFSYGGVKGPVSDLSLEQDVIADICKKSSIGHDESPLNKGSSIFIPSEEDMSIFPLPIIGQDERKETCDVLNKKIRTVPPEIKGSNYSSEIREDNELVPSDLANHPGPLSSADSVLPSEFPENIVERGLLLSHCTIPIEKNGTSPSVETIFLVPSIADTYEQNSLSEPKVPPSQLEVVDTNTEEDEEFEDVKLEDLFEEQKQVDYWNDAEDYELALISRRAMKNHSYKTRLRNAFKSNFCSPKKRSSDRGASFYGAIIVDLVKRDTATASSGSSRGLKSSDLSTTEPREPEWELL